jgi:hypothetical protein
VSYETPTYYDRPTYGTTPAYTPFDDAHAINAMCHSCDNFTNSSSYSPHSEQLTTYIQGDYTGPFSNPQGPQYNPDNDYAALHSPYNAQATSHRDAAPEGHREPANLGYTLYHLPEHIGDYLDPSDGYQGPLSGWYEPQEPRDASQDAQPAYDEAWPQDAPLAKDGCTNIVNGHYDVQEGFYGYTDQGNELQSPLNGYNDPDNTYSTAKPQDASLANDGRTNVVNGSYEVQEGFYGYTDQGNIPQSPHNDECEPPGLPDALYNVYDVAHPHNTSLANDEQSYPKNEAYDTLEHFDSPYSPHDNAYHTHNAQVDDDTLVTDDELQIEGNGTFNNREPLGNEGEAERMYRDWNDPMYEQRRQTENYEEEGYADDAFERRILEVSREEVIQSRKDGHDELMRELRRRMDLSDGEYVAEMPGWNDGWMYKEPEEVEEWDEDYERRAQDWEDYLEECRQRDEERDRELEEKERALTEMEEHYPAYEEGNTEEGCRDDEAPQPTTDDEEDLSTPYAYNEGLNCYMTPPPTILDSYETK